jgi:hypothetical protein
MWGIEGDVGMMESVRGVTQMPHIVLTDEQARVIDDANDFIEIRRQDGRVLARIPPDWTPAQIADAKRRAAAPGPRYTGDQIQSMFGALEAEWERTGGFDREYAREFIRRMDSGREAG